MNRPIMGVFNVLICKSCGRENEEEFKFCLGCGASLAKPKVAAPVAQAPAMIDCSQCGTSVPSQFKFCGSCGASIRTQAAEANPNTQPEPPASPPILTAAETAAPTRLLGRLTVIRPDGSEGATIELMEDEVVLGRDSASEALSTDPFLSPRHASIIHEGGNFFVHDHKSLNGVFIRVRDEMELEDGDEIRIGQELMHFEVMANKSDSDKSGGGARRAGSPDSGAWARLSLVAGPGKTSRAFVCTTDEVTIGREIGAILFRDDGFVSGKHARIVRRDGKIFLRDLGSSNGTFLRIRKDRRAIERGDLILMGQQLFRLHV